MTDTKSAPDERAELKPCPFCGDPMKYQAEQVVHENWRQPCPNALWCFEVAAWNTRTPPQVKPLVWERADLTCWGETAQNGMGGSYRMTWEFGEGPNGEDTFFTVRFDGVGLYSGWSFDADLAMAAAQADYTRRILEALA